jgi:hypothetical protein
LRIPEEYLRIPEEHLRAPEEYLRIPEEYLRAPEVSRCTVRQARHGDSQLIIHNS